MTEIQRFAELVKMMRDRQKAYFKDRSSNDLMVSKSLEKRVDKEADEILEGRLLFGREESERP